MRHGALASVIAETRRQSLAQPKSNTRYSEADKLRRHQRIIIDLGLLASQTMPLDQFVKLAVSQVALALEVSNTKVLRYRPEEADLLRLAGVGWREGMVGQTVFGIDLRSAPGRETAEAVVVDDIRK